LTIPDIIETSVWFDGQIDKLKVDPVLFKRIIVNLVTNAIQAMPNGGKLSIKSYKKDDKAVIMVEDTGVGIPDEVKPKLFVPLFTTKAKGQGFGLPVVKRMVEILGGTISFESEIGKGTKFVVKLPAE
jgi:signal transduction histidine kinase